LSSELLDRVAPDINKSRRLSQIETNHGIGLLPVIYSAFLRCQSFTELHPIQISHSTSLDAVESEGRAFAAAGTQNYDQRRS
jgi:hypothetical protein